MPDDRRRYRTLAVGEQPPRSSLVGWGRDEAHEHGRRGVGRVVLSVVPNGVDGWHAHIRDRGSHRLDLTVHRHAEGGANTEGPPVAYTQSVPPHVDRDELRRQVAELLRRITEITNPPPAPAGTTSEEDTHE